MYKIIDEKPIQKTTEKKPTHKRPYRALMVLFPTILLILIFGATMGTVIGFKSQLKSFEDRIVRLEESTMLKMDHKENDLDLSQKKMAGERFGKEEPLRRVDVSGKTVKKRSYNQTPKLVKVSRKTSKKNNRTARSGETLNNISAPL